MSGDRTKPSDTAGDDFRAAFAQWRLALHTEVKQTTSLPTAMFDAMDPMLEMQLAETTEKMLAQLHKPHAHLTAASNATERRLEVVDAEELRRVAARIAEREPCRIDLLADLSSEYLAVLADACCSARDSIRARAAANLADTFGITSANLEEALGQLEEVARAARIGREAKLTDDAIAEIVDTVRGALLAELASARTDEEAPG